MKTIRFSLVFLFALTWLVPAALPACTNIMVTRGASKDGSTFITYSADSHTLYGELQFIPAGRFPAGAMIDVYERDTGKYLGKIKQAAQTYTVIGDMNEYQVAIGETTYGGREELVDPKGGIDYGSLMTLALQRSRTAREAIKAMTDLVAEYGYYSSGESFSIADPNEVWIMEMIGKGPGKKGAVWVALRVPEGYICGHANQARIRQFPQNDKANCLYAPDVIAFAREKGWYSGADKDFSFRDTYHPLEFGGLRACEARVWNAFRRASPASKQMDPFLDYAMGRNPGNPMPLWIKPDQKLGLGDVMALMRDHYEGTPMAMTEDVGAGPFKLPYRWRPMGFKVDGVDYINERAISTQQTGYSWVAQGRSWLPRHIGGVLWFGVDDTYSTVYVPFYCGISAVPRSWAVGTGRWDAFSWDAAFWVFNFVSNWAYGRYSDMIQDIQVVQGELEGKFMADQLEIDKAALAIHEQANPAPAPKSRVAAREENTLPVRDFLTRYSCEQGEMVVRRWRELGERLIVKYLDGNVRDALGNVQHPKYPPDWYERIAKERGEILKVVRQEKK